MTDNLTGGILRTHFFLFILLLSASAYGKSDEDICYDHYVEIITENDILHTTDELVERLHLKRVAYLGETHDKYSHHLLQLGIIKALFERNSNVAVGMEMFEARFQDVINDYVAGRVSEEEFLEKTQYGKRWGFDYALYRPIIDFLRDNNIPLIALNTELEIVRRIASEGITSLTSDELNRLPSQIDFTNYRYRQWLMDIYEHHPSEKMKFENFHSAQIIRDEAMAETAHLFLIHNPKTQLIVLAGNGHILYSFGIPSRNHRRNKLDYTTVLMDVKYERGVADYVINTAGMQCVK